MQQTAREFFSRIALIVFFYTDQKKTRQLPRKEESIQRIHLFDIQIVNDHHQYHDYL